MAISNAFEQMAHARASTLQAISPPKPHTYLVVDLLLRSIECKQRKNRSEIQNESFVWASTTTIARASTLSITIN